MKKRKMLKKSLAASLLICLTVNVNAAELIFQFNSPAFNGQGYSNHVLTIEQVEQARKQKIKDEQKAAADAEKRAASNTNLAKFLNNVESRIYAQLSKQLADEMFTDGGATQGSMDFQGTNISWVRSGSEVTLTIIEANGSRTDLTVPVAQFGF
jgi:hypothetical protein